MFVFETKYQNHLGLLLPCPMSALRRPLWSLEGGWHTYKRERKTLGS